MTDFIQHASGLVFPVEAPVESPPPGKRYGPLEITDPEKRKRAEQALAELCQALDLPGGWRFNPQVHEARHQAWEYVCTLALGESLGYEELC